MYLFILSITTITIVCNAPGTQKQQRPTTFLMVSNWPTQISHASAMHIHSYKFYYIMRKENKTCLIKGNFLLPVTRLGSCVSNIQRSRWSDNIWYISILSGKCCNEIQQFESQFTNFSMNQSNHLYLYLFIVKWPVCFTGKTSKIVKLKK